MSVPVRRLAARTASTLLVGASVPVWVAEPLPSPGPVALALALSGAVAAGATATDRRDGFLAGTLAAVFAVPLWFLWYLAGWLARGEAVGGLHVLGLALVFSWLALPLGLFALACGGVGALAGALRGLPG